MAADRLGAWRAFLVAHSEVMKRLEHELTVATGLTLAWYEVLFRLGAADAGRLRMQELADSLLLTPSGLTRVVDRMEAAGLVRRERCTEDRRGSYAVLTREGRARLRKAAPVHLGGVEEHFTSRLSDREAAVLEKALGKVLASLR